LIFSLDRDDEGWDRISLKGHQVLSKGQYFNGMPERRRYQWVLAHVAAALGCAALALLASGPPRFVAGVLLGLVLPGRLAVVALLPSRPGLLGHVLTVPLSLATCATVGLVVAGTRHGFHPVLVVAGLAAACLLLACIATVRRYRRQDRRVRSAGFGVGPIGSLRPRVWWLAAVPTLALSAFLVVQLAAATHHRTADSYYTEFAVEGSDVVVRSREREAVHFRYEASQGGVVVQSAEFNLRPGEQARFALYPAPGARVEARLYRAGAGTPYRRLIR
jgi:hypothetical protein